MSAPQAEERAALPSKTYVRDAKGRIRSARAVKVEVEEVVDDEMRGAHDPEQDLPRPLSLIILPRGPQNS